MPWVVAFGKVYSMLILGFLFFKIPADSTEHSSSIDGAVSVEDLQKQLEDEVASECPRNGELVIRMIEKPFIDSDIDKREMEGWKIRLRSVN